jgi:transcriptional antiterminator RfaH
MLPETESTARWYLIQAKPREDERAFEHLGRQGFQCYRPTHPVERLRYGRRQAGIESLFPGYFFIHLNCVNDNWRPIRSTRGVIRIVSFSDEPLPVADEIIAGIQARLERKPSVPQPYFEPGDRVLITEGPFSQLEAIFVSTDGKERVTLLLTMMQRDQALNFPVAIVRKLK